ncbi:hypothetical protein EDB19DRAFT_1832530 [Suillus lakei]|nr:hypothetical protein EDB19DRAFT_1832530 [Suillus lakei]
MRTKSKGQNSKSEDILPSPRHGKVGLKLRVIGLWIIAREQVGKVSDYVQKQGNGRENEKGCNSAVYCISHVKQATTHQWGWTEQIGHRMDGFLKTVPAHTISQITNNTGTTNLGSHPLPEKGLDIPSLPVCTGQKPILDVVSEWLRGKNKAIFGLKYHQCALITLEFLEHATHHLRVPGK